MKLSRLTALAVLLFAVASVTRGDDAKSDKADLKDKLVGKWQATKGSIDTKYTLDIQMYKVNKFSPPWGDYWVTQYKENIPGRGGKNLPAGDYAVGHGSYSIDGDKFTITPLSGMATPFKATDKKIVWTLTKATDDTLIFTTEDNKTEEFKKKKKADK
jgi:hypothetical protein